MPIENDDKGKQTNEIKRAIPLFEAIDIEGKNISVDPGHGRIETRKIWTSTKLNDHLDLPCVGQAFVIKRERINKKTLKVSNETVYGITGRTPDQVNAHRILQTNRGHWCIENNCHYILDRDYDEDRSRIRSGHGPENLVRLRRFAIGLIKSKGVTSVAQKMRELTMNMRVVFDSLRMTKILMSCPLAKRGRRTNSPGSEQVRIDSPVVSMLSLTSFVFVPLIQVKSFSRCSGKALGEVGVSPSARCFLSIQWGFPVLSPGFRTTDAPRRERRPVPNRNCRPL